MRANKFEWNGKSAPEVHASRSWLKLFWSLGMSTRLSLMSLSIVWVLTMKKGVGLSCTKWSGIGVALLMSSRQGETSQHIDIKHGVAG